MIGIQRYVTYPAQSDQPLLSDIIASSKAKFNADPQAVMNSTKDFGINFDNGKTYVPASAAMAEQCSIQYDAGGNNLTQYVQKINTNGRCDVVLRFTYQPGISANHVASFTLTLSDNERTKANLTADLAFLNDYVSNLQNNVRGAAPKL